MQMRGHDAKPSEVIWVQTVDYDFVKERAMV